MYYHGKGRKSLQMLYCSNVQELVEMYPINCFLCAAKCQGIRKKWCIAMKRDSVLSLSTLSCSAVNNFDTTKEMGISALLDQVESQRDYIHTRFGGMGLRPYLNHLYAPIPEKSISTKKLHDEILVQIFELIEDAVMVVVYLIILHNILFLDRQELATYGSIYLKNLLAGSWGVTKTHLPMSNHDYYEYLNHTLLGAIFPAEWYQFNPLSRSSAIIDNLNTVITPPRLRQVRIKNDSCQPYHLMKWLDTHCLGEFSVDYEDTLPHLPGWQEATVNKPAPLMWKYTPPIVTGDHHFVGLLSAYVGGGYIAEIMPDRRSASDMIHYLRKTGWISLQTRLLSLNMLLYNVHANCFTMITVYLEKSATGYFRGRRFVVTKQWLFVNQEIISAFMQIFAISVLWMALLTFKKISGLMKSLATFFKDIWNAIDLTLIIMSVICVTMIILRLEMLDDFISRLLRTNFEKYLPHTHLTRLEQILLIISIMVIICATVRLWKLLRFGRVFRIMETTLIMAAPPLFCAFLCHVVLTVGFSILGIALFGPYSVNFQGTIGNTLTILLLMSVNLAGTFDYSVLRLVPYTLGYIYLTMFLISTLTIYSIYKTIVIMSYSKAKQYFSNELAFEYTTKDYIKDNFNMLFRKKSRLKGGGHIKEKVFPKADEFRFANGYFIATYELILFQYLVLCFLRNRFRTSNEDVTTAEIYDEILIQRTVDHFFANKAAWEGKELFFKGQMVGQHIGFVDEARIVQMESVVNVMLLTAEERIGLSDRERLLNKKLEHNVKHLDYMYNSLQDILKILNNVEVGMPKF